MSAEERHFDILTDHGIIVLSETERHALLNLVKEAIDARFKSNDAGLMDVNLYNKLAIGRAVDGTVEHHFGIHRQKKQEKRNVAKKSTRKRKS